MGTSRDYTAGQILTATMADDWAQGHLGSNAATADVGPTSGTTTLDLLGATAVTVATTNRILKISALWRSYTGSVLADRFAFRIQEGATVFAEHLVDIRSTSEGHGGGSLIVAIGGVSAGSHTYKLTLSRVGGGSTGTCTVQAAAAYPMKILVEDIGTA